MEEHAVVFSGRRGRREGVGEGFSKEEQRFSEKHRTGTERRRGGKRETVRTVTGILRGWRRQEQEWERKRGGSGKGGEGEDVGSCQCVLSV